MKRNSEKSTEEIRRELADFLTHFDELSQSDNVREKCWL